METQQHISLEANRRLVGSMMPALVAGPLPEMELLLEARLRGQAPEIDGRLLINDGVASPGSMVEVEITEAHPYDVVGRLVRVLTAGEANSVRLPVMG
jgi:ribosomal protein S12 methylthiotransferase